MGEQITPYEAYSIIGVWLSCIMCWGWSRDQNGDGCRMVVRMALLPSWLLAVWSCSSLPSVQERTDRTSLARDKSQLQNPKYSVYWICITCAPSESWKNRESGPICTFRWFSWFTVVESCKITVCIEFPGTEPLHPGGNTALGSFGPLVQALSSVDPCLTLPYVCFCLKTPSLIYISGSLIWNTAHSSITHAWTRLSSTCVCSRRHNSDFSHSGTLHSPSALGFPGCWQQWNH